MNSGEFKASLNIVYLVLQCVCSSVCFNMLQNKFTWDNIRYQFGCAENPGYVRTWILMTCRLYHKTTDETWVQYYIPDSKNISLEWRKLSKCVILSHLTNSILAVLFYERLQSFSRNLVQNNFHLFVCISDASEICFVNN